MIIVQIGSNKFKVESLEAAVEIVRVLEKATAIDEQYRNYPEKNTYHLAKEPPVISIELTTAELTERKEVKKPGVVSQATIDEVRAIREEDEKLGGAPWEVKK